MATKDRKKTGGRAKGTRNKSNLFVEEIAARFDIDPFEVLMMVAVGDWKGLGFEAPTKISYTGAGIEFEEPNIKLCDRVAAARDACKYLYAAKQAVAVSTGEGGLKVTIEDYSREYVLEVT